MRYLLVLCLACTLACGSVAPAAPSAPLPAPRTMDYAINIPDVAVTHDLQRQYPNGVQVNPLAAQDRWDYTHAYGGTPNVYYGETAPPCQNFLNTGVVIAPHSVAGLDAFTAKDWPGVGLETGLTYVWVGRFTYSLVAPVGSYGVCPTR